MRINWPAVNPSVVCAARRCTGTIYLVLGDIREALVLFASVFVVIGITFYQERKTERALEALRELSNPRAQVLRDGEWQSIAGRESWWTTL